MKEYPLLKYLRRLSMWSGLLLLLWALAVQAGCLAMRTPDSAWTEKLAERGQKLAPRFADIKAPNGRLIHAVQVGAADTLPVVAFVHGSPGSADAFLDYLADTLLSSRAQLISIDRPGFGYTSGFGRPEPSLHAQSDALMAVLDSLAPNQPAILVGHSLGGPIIACAAMHYPERVRGLFIIGGSIDPELEPDPWWQPVVHHPPVRWLIPKSMWTSNAEIIPLRGELERMLPFWKNIQCPVTMVHARNDRLVPFGNVDFARRMLAGAAGYQELVFDKGDHFIVWSERVRVREAILEQLRIADYGLRNFFD